MGTVGSVRDIEAVAFVDDQHGWAGGQGAIIATSDGGQTWTRQYRGPAKAFILALDFADLLHGWAVAVDRLLRTLDGGATWVPAREPKGLLLETVNFISATHGWGIASSEGAGGPFSQKVLVRTVDGGRTWQTMQRGIGSVCFAGTEGYANSGATILKSTDGGRTWAPVFRAKGHWFEAELRCPTPWIAWALFTDGSAAGNAPYVVYRTADSGETWKPLLAHWFSGNVDPRLKGLPAIDAYSGPFAASDAERAVFVGSCAPCRNGRMTVVTTADGGRHWTRTIVYGFLPGFGVQAAIGSFPDHLHGWIVGVAVATNRSEILATDDGGRTWHQVFGSSP